VGILKAGENCKSKPPAVYIVNFPRGLRHHRYICVALRAFYVLNLLNPLNPLNLIFRGAYAAIAIIVSPYGLLGTEKGKRKKALGANFSRGAYATIAIFVTPYGLLGTEKGKRKKALGANFFRGAYATIAIFVTPYGLFMFSTF
jgi:hypothetical protein